MTRHWLKAASALAAAAVLITAWRVASLPPRQASGQALPPTFVTVAYHLHTTRSDGTGSLDEVAAAAAQAGVRVVVITDHGDGTRPADAPQYRHGVLVADAVEIGTTAGHYVAVGARVSPYPLGGAPDAVVDDVAALGGFGVAAHPLSPREGLRWQSWTAPIDGVEWLNADSEWRDRPRALWSSLVTYPWRPVETIVALLDRPRDVLATWDRLAAARPLVGLAAHDAHARIGVGGMAEPYDGAVALRAPSYAAMLAAFTNVALLDAPLGGDAAADAARVIEALRRGHVYSVVTGRRSVVPVTFEALADTGERGGPGERVTASGHVAVTMHAEVPGATDATTRLLCDGREVATAHGGSLSWPVRDAPAACRLEVQLDDEGRAPWIVTNPIYLHPPAVAQTRVEAMEALALPNALDAASWVPEHANDADAAAAAGGDAQQLAFRWRLGESPATYAAWRFETPAGLATSDGLRVHLAADRVRRVWMQLRTPDGRRWGRSVRLGPDTGATAFDLRFADFAPLEGQPAGLPRADVRAVLLVVDTVNTEAGQSGVIDLRGLSLLRASASGAGPGS